MADNESLKMLLDALLSMKTDSIEVGRCACRGFAPCGRIVALGFGTLFFNHVVHRGSGRGPMLRGSRDLLARNAARCHRADVQSDRGRREL